MQQHPHLRCIALLDEADPGFPSFLALHTSSHLDLFGGRLLPEAFVNQGGDPWLFELYRRFGLSGVCPSVWVSNGIGEASCIKWVPLLVSSVSIGDRCFMPWC